MSSKQPVVNEPSAFEPLKVYRRIRFRHNPKMQCLVRSNTENKAVLTLKAPITTAADDIHKYFHCFSEKIRLEVSSDSSASGRGFT